MKKSNLNAGYLLETISIQKGIPQNLYYHQQRINRSTASRPLYHFDVAAYISQIDLPEQEWWKLRIVYRPGERDYQLVRYKMKPISSITCVYIESNYQDKWLDRSAIQACYDQREDADDVLLVKNHYVTDTSYANVCFWDGNTWITPNEPLLAGTKRAKLLDSQEIIPLKIHIRDLPKFQKVSLINAFLDLGQIVLPIEAIRQDVIHTQ